MRNDVQVKATWITNFDGNSTIYFDYFNKNGDYIGDIIVTNKGKMSWYVIDATYKEDITYVINYIMGKTEERKLQDETKDEQILRWYNLRMYLYTHNIVLNHRQGEEDKNITR